MEKTSDIDKLKTLAVFLIVWGHHFQQPLTKYFFSFHVPLLFFVSGIWLSNLYKGDFSRFIKAAMKRILIPYFIFSILLYLMWFALIFLSGAASSKGLSPLMNFLGIFYAQGMNEYMAWGMHMWIFPCVFIVSLITFFILKIKNKKPLFWGSIFLLFIIGLTFHQYIVSFFIGKKEFLLPWSIDTSLVGLLFFITGIMLQDVNISWKSLPLNIVVLISLLIAGVLLQRFNVWIDTKNNIYGNPILFSISAFCSVLFSFFLCMRIPDQRILTFVGESAILVFVFHLRVWTVVNLVRAKLFPHFIDTGLLNTFIFSLIQIGIILFGAYILRIIGFHKKLSWLYSE